MQQFAKVFDTASLGQIVVMLISAEESGGPEIRYWFIPGIEQLYVCEHSLEYFRWEEAQAAFDEITEEIATETISEVVKNILRSFAS
jgi:hypothetical protein